MKYNRIFTLMIFLLGIWHYSAMAQREVVFAHIMMGQQEINPAYVGSRQSFSVASLNRSHWTLIFDKAPISQSLTLNTPINRENIGLGMSFRNERFGPEKTTSLFGDFSFKINMTRESTLSFGLKVGIGLFTVPLTELIIDDPSDPAFASDTQSHWLPNFGFGIYYLHPRFFFGASIPKFLEVNYFENTFTGGVRNILQERNYYITAGGAIDIGPDIYLIPSSYVRLQRNSPVEAGFTVEAFFMDRFSAGAMIRLQDAVGVMIGLRLNDQLSFGYSFDWSVLNRVPSFNFGSHEIVLRYDIVFLDSHRMRTRRYF